MIFKPVFRCSKPYTYSTFIREEKEKWNEFSPSTEATSNVKIAFWNVLTRFRRHACYFDTLNTYILYEPQGSPFKI